MDGCAAHQGATLQIVLGRILELVGAFSVMIVNDMLAQPVRHRKFRLQGSISGPQVRC